MKKIFTLIGLLVGFASLTSAATVDDIAPLKHSYVLVCDDWNNNGSEKIAKGALYGDNHFFTPTGHDVGFKEGNHTKGYTDLSQVDALGEEGAPLYVTQEIVDKYGEYGLHYNSMRLKNAQDVLALKLTAKTKLIIFLQGNNKSGTSARIPRISKNANLEDREIDGKKYGLNDAPGADYPSTVAGFRWEYTVDDDGLYYIGSYNGDMFVSYIIVEANEAPGTPSVKVGEQTYENGLWFREVSVKTNSYKMEGSDEAIPTLVTYTTDGSAPNASSPVYTEPIKCYQDMVVKFQAYQDWGLGADEGFICDGADNDANVNFSFDAPSIDALGANVTITSPYEGAKNFYTLNDGEAQEGSSFTLTESATISAYSQIVNGSYTTFTTNKSSKDVYVLNPIKEKKVIEVIAGDVVLDEEATATSTTGEVYTIQNGEISADKMDFFVKDLTFKAIKDEQYQVPAGNERYIQMSNTNITFQVAEGDSVAVKVICSKNACKNIDAEDAEDGSQVNDRKCVVTVNGTNYTHMELQDVTYKDAEGNDSIVNELVEAADLKLYENANIIEFSLTGGIYTFQKYSGTGNIMISSIEIAPAAAEPVLADFEDGKYYLVNMSSEKAWGCGNAWGTQASLVKHPEYNILHKQENGTYLMETQASNGDDSYYFGGDQGEYMDGKPEAAVALTIIKGEELGETENGTTVYAYYITADGTNFYGWDGTENTKLAKNLPANDEKAAWIIVSHEDALAGLADATEEEPMDATFLILDPNFSRNNRNQSAWTGDTFGVGGDNTNTNAEKWGGNSQTFDISQTVEAPNGKYKLSWNGFYRYNNTGDNTNDIAVAAHADGTEVINSFVYANGKSYPLTSIADETAAATLANLPFSQGDASAAFGQGLYAQSDFVIVNDGKLTIGIKKTEHLGCDWTVWDNFELEYYGPASEDGIETIQTVKVLNGAVYNLAGQKVDASYKGVVIANGKKMLQK